MAKIIKKKRRSGGAAKKAATKIKYVTRNVVTKAKKAYRSGRSWNVSKKDIVISIAGAGAGAVAAPLVVNVIPSAIPATASNALIAAAGGFLAYKGLKKKNMILTGAGMGMAASATAGLISGFMKKDSSSMSGPIAAVSYRPALPSIPMGGAYCESTMGASFRDAIITDEVSEDEV